MQVRLNPWLCLTLLICFTLNAEAKTSICTPYGVRSFKIEKFKRFSDIPPGEELCSNDAILTKHPSLAAVIENAQATMKKVSETLDMSQNELFPNGIELTAKSGPLGSLDEGASGDSVYLFQFDDWDGSGFDPSGFSHELGHVIASTLPDDRAIHDLRSIPFLREGFPDLVSYATTGAVFLHQNDLPQAINQFANRDLNQSYSYNRKLNFYLETYAYWGLNRICKQLPEALRSEKHTKVLCEGVAQNVLDPSFQKTFAFTKESFSSDRCLQLWAPEWEGWSCDMHQISLPWTSSFVRSGRKNVLEILKLLTQPSTLNTRHYACHFSGDLDHSHWIDLTAKSWSDVFESFYVPLSTTEKQLWDKLSESSSLQSSKDFDQKWQLTHVFPQRALAVIDQRKATQTDPVYNSQNPCYQWGVNTFGAPPECVMTCEEN